MILKNKRDNFQPEFGCMNVYTPKIKKDTKSVEIQGNMTIYGETEISLHGKLKVKMDMSPLNSSKQC